MVASRALAPSSKLEVTRWIADDVHIDGLEQPTHTDCYRAMDFLLEALDQLQETVFFTAADLLSLDVDLIFFDTTSTYFELDFEDGELDDDQGDEAFRRRGHSKDSRPDLPQVVIGMAVTTGGLPVRLWVWPGNTTDASVLEEVKTDLAGWLLNRTVWVVDAGFASKDNRKVLTRGGSGFIIAERMRGSDAQVVEARGRQGRFRKVDDTLEVKDILVGDGPSRERFVMVRNLQQATRDAYTRDRLVALLERRIDGSDELDRDARRSCADGSARSPACGATCASPRPDSCASIEPRSPPRPRPTGAPCCAPATSRWTPRTSRGATRPCSMSNAGSGTSNSSTYARSTTAAPTGSSRTCNCAGSRSC